MSESTAMTANNQDNALASLGGPDNPFLMHAKAVGVSSGVYMRHNGNTGKYIVGDESLDGGVYLFDIQSARLAWLGFDMANKPVNGPEVSFRDRVPLADPPPTPGVKWQKQIKFALIDFDTGGEIILSCKADRPTRAAWRLIRAYGEQVGRHPDGKGWMIPVVEASSRSFEMDIDEPQPDGTVRKMRVKKYSDTYDIVDWKTGDEVAEIVALKETEPSNDGGASAKVIEPEIIPPSKPTQATPAAPSGTTARSRFGSR